MNRKNIVLVLLVVLSLFLSACSSLKVPTTELAVKENSTEVSLPSRENGTKLLPANHTPETLATNCTAGWVCLSSSAKIYRDENCSLGKRENCKLGCVDDECRKPSICTTGFKCNGQHYKGLQIEDCSWLNQVKCDWGCADAECLPQPNETVTMRETSTIPETTTPTTNVQTLAAGAGKTIQVGNVEYTLRIYNLRESQVQLQLDDFRSKWINEGEKYTFSNGVTIKVSAVLLRGSSSHQPSEIEYLLE